MAGSLPPEKLLDTASDMEKHGINTISALMMVREVT